jgi:predicted flap endonuclease-1-like 5' DNA nuclease
LTRIPVTAELPGGRRNIVAAIAAGLNERGIWTPREVGEWKAGSVAQLLARM